MKIFFIGMSFGVIIALAGVWFFYFRNKKLEKKIAQLESEKKVREALHENIKKKLPTDRAGKLNRFNKLSSGRTVKHNRKNKSDK